jgi:hypothetical protein
MKLVHYILYTVPTHMHTSHVTASTSLQHTTTTSRQRRQQQQQQQQRQRQRNTRQGGGRQGNGRPGWRERAQTTHPASFGP